MSRFAEIESYETLISAVKKYQDDLQTNYKILVNAANVCDAAMGNDDLAKKHINNLYCALEQLTKTSDIVAQVAVELKTEKQKLLDIHNNI